MTNRWTAYLIILALEWLFVSGLWRAYGWFSTKLFLLQTGDSSRIRAYFFLFLFAVAIVCLVLVIIRRPFAWFGVAQPRTRGVWATFLLLAFVFPVAFLGRLIVPSFDAWYAGQSGFLVWSLLGSALLIVALAVVKEELLERLAQRLLLERFGPLLASVALASQFGLAHFFRFPLNYGIVSAVSVALVGFVLALLYARTRNFWLALLFHLVFNSIVIEQIMLHASGDSVGEALLWLVWGVAWIVTFRPALRWLREAMRGPRLKLDVVDWVFLVVFGLGAPIGFLVLYT